MAFLFFICFAMMAGVAFLAISKKSTFKIRIAAIGALALMIVSAVVCMVVYSREAAKPKQLFLPDMMPSDMPPPQASNNSVTMIMLVVFMVALFAVVLFLAMKEQRRASGKEDPPSNGW